MGCERGEPVHLELITDGNASTLTVLKIYNSGSTTERTLASDERLNITDIQILLEAGGDFALVADAAAAGKYIAYGSVQAQGGVVKHFETPYSCPLGVTPKFSGAASDRNVCICEGFITKT